MDEAQFEFESGLLIRVFRLAMSIAMVSKVLEQLIDVKFYDKLGLRFKEHKNWTLINYPENLKKNDFYS